MESSKLYSNMRDRLDAIRMNGRDRAQAERHMRRAAAIVETLLGREERKPVAGSAQEARTQG